MIKNLIALQLIIILNGISVFAMEQSNCVSMKFLQKPEGGVIFSQIMKLKKAICKKNMEKVTEIVESGIPLNIDSTFYSPLGYAVAINNVDIAELLIKNGADVNFRFDVGTPLSYVRSVEMLKLFLDHGGDIKLARNDEGVPLLTIAVELGNVPMVAELLKYEDINGIYQFSDSIAGTPLMIAIQENKRDMVEYLLQQGANPNIYVKGYYIQKHHTALELAKAIVYLDKDIETLLIEHGAKE